MGFYAGAIYSPSIIPIIENSKFTDNKAIQTKHNDILSPPIRLSITNDNENIAANGYYKIINMFRLSKNPIVSSLLNSLNSPFYIKLI